MNSTTGLHFQKTRCVGRDPRQKSKYSGRGKAGSGRGGACGGWCTSCVIYALFIFYNLNSTPTNPKIKKIKNQKIDFLI